MLLSHDRFFVFFLISTIVFISLLLLWHSSLESEPIKASGIDPWFKQSEEGESQKGFFFIWCGKNCMNWNNLVNICSWPKKFPFQPPSWTLSVCLLCVCRSQRLPSVWPVPSPLQWTAVWRVQRRLLQVTRWLCSLWLQWQRRSSRSRPALSPQNWPLFALHQQRDGASVPVLRAGLRRQRHGSQLHAAKWVVLQIWFDVFGWMIWFCFFADCFLRLPLGVTEEKAGHHLIITCTWCV